VLKLKLYQQLSFFFFLNPIAHFLVFCGCLFSCARSGDHENAMTAESWLKLGQIYTGSIPDSDTVLQKAVYTPLLHRLFPVPDPGNGRCRDCAIAEQGQESLKQGTNKVKTKYESDPNNLTFLLSILKQNRAFKWAKSVPLVYGLFMGSVPKSY
jgi:hypothetical protein